MNVLWFLFSGMELAAMNFLIGVLLCCTIVGIPFGKQYFKIAKLALAPFGATVVRTNIFQSVIEQLLCHDLTWQLFMS